MLDSKGNRGGCPRENLLLEASNWDALSTWRALLLCGSLWTHTGQGSLPRVPVRSKNSASITSLPLGRVVMVGGHLLNKGKWSERQQECLESRKGPPPPSTQAPCLGRGAFVLLKCMEKKKIVKKTTNLLLVSLFPCSCAQEPPMTGARLGGAFSTRSLSSRLLR